MSNPSYSQDKSFNRSQGSLEQERSYNRSQKSNQIDMKKRIQQIAQSENSQSLNNLSFMKKYQQSQKEVIIKHTHVDKDFLSLSHSLSLRSQRNLVMHQKASQLQTNPLPFFTPINQASQYITNSSIYVNLSSKPTLCQNSINSSTQSSSYIRLRKNNSTLPNISPFLAKSVITPQKDKQPSEMNYFSSHLYQKKIKEQKNQTNNSTLPSIVPLTRGHIRSKTMKENPIQQEDTLEQKDSFSNIAWSNRVIPINIPLIMLNENDSVKLNTPPLKNLDLVTRTGTPAVSNFEAFSTTNIPMEEIIVSSADQKTYSEMREIFEEELKSVLLNLIKSNKDFTEAAGLYRSTQATANQNKLSWNNEDQELLKLLDFSEYLLGFTGYVLDLVWFEIPTFFGLKLEFHLEKNLVEKLQEVFLSASVMKLKEVGLSDIIERFRLVFEIEFPQILVPQQLQKDLNKNENFNVVGQLVIDSLCTQYEKNISKEAFTCISLLSDLLADDKEKVAAQIYYIRQKMKRDQFEEIEVVEKPKKNETKDEKGIIAKAANYSFLTTITLFDLFFVKKTIYETMKKQIKGISLINRAKVLEKLETLRFGFFKELYSLGSDDYQELIKIIKQFIGGSTKVLAYFQRSDQEKQIGKFLKCLFDSIIGDSTLTEFLEKSQRMIDLPLDGFLISMVEQGVKGSLSQIQINHMLQKEVDFKFIMLKRRAGLTVPFRAVFYQIEQIMALIHGWIGVLEKHKQLNGQSKYGEGFVETIKKTHFLEYILVCSFSEYDTFSLSDLVCGLKFNGIEKQHFEFWLRGIRRVLTQIKVRQSEIDQIEAFFQKIINNAF